MATRAHDAAAESSSFSHFSLMEGGPLHPVARALGLPAGRAGCVRLGVVLALLTWVPLVVLTARSAAHPDTSGCCRRTRALGVAQVGLAPLSFALSAVLVGTYAEQVAHGLADIQRIVLPLVSIVVANVLLITAPLLLFAPRLIETKRRGLVDYGGLASDYTRAFDAKWLRKQPPPSEPLLGSADVQSLADLANAFKIIGEMKFVPLSAGQALILAGAAALPAAPLILFVVPLDQLIIRGVRTILQI